LDFGAGTVSGQLTDAADPDGKPVAQTPLAQIEVAMIPADPGRRTVEIYYRHARSDASGKFRISGVIPGDYFVVPWEGQDIWPVMDPDVFAQLQKSAVSVTVPASSTVTQDLKMTPELRTIALGALQ
jgi:hypothetical protein